MSRLNEPLFRELCLRDGAIAIVDASDFEWLSKYEWSLHTGGYAQRRVGSRRIYMHAAIAGPHHDHRNGNRLDNRRSNLRPATKSQNAANSRMRSDNRSGYRGVSFHPASGLWRARVCERTTYHATPEEAARARDAIALAMFGEFARLNFGATP